jgi:phasin family protein
MTDVDQKTGKPTPAKPASAPKPAAAAKSVAKPAPAAKAAPVAKAAPAAKPSTVKPSTVKPTVAKPAVAKTPVVKAEADAVKPAVPAKPVSAKPAPAKKAPVAKAAAPKPAAPKPAPAKVAPVPAEPDILHDLAPVVLPPVVAAAIAAMEVSKPVVEAPVSSATAPKASTTPAVLPFSQFKVPNMTTQSFKGFEDITAFGKANLEAFVQANQLFAKGFESLSKEVVSLAQSSLESSTAATKAMFAAKTLKEAAELQADFAKTSFEKMVANSTKIGELTVKLATDSAAPIGARVTAASEKIVKKA